MVTPIFLFSLPRSGSTLVQRVLGAHPEIATVSEPWILLPLLYTMREKEAHANYVHHSAVKAIQDFYGEFPNGRDDYLSELRQLVLNLYVKTAAYKNQQYFLDKTPRYHLITKEIIELFSSGKFIILWRNPLAIAASMMQTWGNGNWVLYRFHIDLYQGIKNLTDTYQQYANRVYSVKYEDLISGSAKSWEKLFAYLKLEFHPNYLEAFSSTQLRGRYGDSIDTNSLTELNKESLEKWKLSFMNPLRQNWGKNYLQKLGDETLSLAGYNLQNLLNELGNCPKSGSYLSKDLIRMIYGIFYQKFEPQILSKFLNKL